MELRLHYWWVLGNLPKNFLTPKGARGASKRGNSWGGQTGSRIEVLGLVCKGD